MNKGGSTQSQSQSQSQGGRERERETERQRDREGKKDRLQILGMQREGKFNWNELKSKTGLAFSPVRSTTQAHLTDDPRVPDVAKQPHHDPVPESSGRLVSPHLGCNQSESGAFLGTTAGRG